MLNDSPGTELSRPNHRVLQYGATAKGKTQDDQNVGKRQKKKKVSKSVLNNGIDHLISRNNINTIYYLWLLKTKADLYFFFG